MRIPKSISLLCHLLLALTLGVSSSRAQSPLAGNISGGFQAQAEGSGGKRSVLRGSDARHVGNNVFEIVSPRLITYNADDTQDMIIEAPRCLFDQRDARNVASSDSELKVRTGDGKFSIEGVGWRWDPSTSELTISNKVTALLSKGALASNSTNLPFATGGATNEPIRITSDSFTYGGNLATFAGNVRVEDGPDILTCGTLEVTFQSPGGLQKIVARTSVHLQQPENEIRGEEAVYDVAQDTVLLTGNPKWTAETREGSANKLLLSRTNKTLLAEGNVYMKLPLTNVVQNPGESERGTVRFLEVASDTFTYHEGATTNDPALAVYENNVRVNHPEGAISSDKLTVYFTPGENRLVRVVAEQNVRIVSDENKAFGDVATYDVDNGKITISGNPHWEVEDKTGSSRFLVFYPKSKEVFALEDVQMNIPSRSMGDLQLFGPSTNKTVSVSTNSPVQISSVIFSHRDNISVFKDSVRLVDVRGTMECETITVMSGASNRVERIVADGGVRIEQENMVAHGEKATYTVADGLVVLTGAPEIISEDRTVNAEAFVIDRIKNTFAIRGAYKIKMRPNEKERASISTP